MTEQPVVAFKTHGHQWAGRSGCLWFCGDEQKAKLRVGDIVQKDDVLLRVRSIGDCVDLRPLSSPHRPTGAKPAEADRWCHCPDRISVGTGVITYCPKCRREWKKAAILLIVGLALAAMGLWW